MIVNRRRSARQPKDHLNISTKANRILNIILVGMILIIMRVWHLTVVQHDEKLEESRKPQRRVVLEPAKRATIRDRFNLPLAINRIQYNAAVLYSQIRQVPSVAWETDSTGKKVKRFKRKEYIGALSQLLGAELSMDSERIEDLIHAKASFYNQIPFVIKEDIAETEYYRLKMLEKDWPGIQVQCIPRRYYMQGKVAADIVGFMGAIGKNEYEAIIHEIKALEDYVDALNEGRDLPLPDGMQTIEQVRRRLKDLQEQAYAVTDSIGKAGIEGRYEGILKGFRGKKSYYSDARGHVLGELPGTREPLSGKRLLLSISSELQKYAEELLIQNENIRLTRLSRLGGEKRTIMAEKEPWIKGGAIVAMDPRNGDIIAMASHPRFDPNDFIFSGDSEISKAKKANVHKWLESESYLAAIWNQQRPLEREAFDIAKGEVYTDEIFLNWHHYLTFILSQDSPLKESVLLNGTIEDACLIQLAVEKVLEFSPEKEAYVLFNYLYKDEKHRPHGKQTPFSDSEGMEALTFDEDFPAYKNILDQYLGGLNTIYDQVLLVDLMRLAVPADRFSKELLSAVGRQSLSDYKDSSASMVKIYETVKKMTLDLFHDLDFRQWRKLYEKDFLKKKRQEEKTRGIYSKPYIDYLDAMESELFKEFWQTHCWLFFEAFIIDNAKDVVASSPELVPYLEYFKEWHHEIAQGAHQESGWMPSYKRLKSAISGLSPELAIEYFKTLRGFHDLNRPLLGKYRYLRKNPEKIQLEKHLAAAFYPKFGYGYGRSQAYRQAATQGSIFKLITAYEALVQRYRNLADNGKDLSSLNPLEIVDLVYRKGKDLYVGYDAEGKPLPRFYKGGRLPRSLIPKIGKLDVVRALEMSSNPYFALLAGEVLHSPEDLANAARNFSFGSRTGIDLPGEIQGKVPDDLESNRTGLYSFAIGQHTLIVTPLQTSIMLSAIANGGKVLKPKIVDMMAGREPKRGRELVSGYQHFPYQEMLGLIGLDFPIFVATDAEQQGSLLTRIPTEIKNNIFLPDEIRRILLDGMCGVVSRSHGESLGSLVRLYRSDPRAISDYVQLKNQLIGKTSTAESIENIDLDLEKGTNIYTHVWFGGITYSQDVVDSKEHQFVFRDSFGDPELVVVVYLRYGGYGKEAAPLAAQVAKKWKEIQKAHQKIH